MSGFHGTTLKNGNIILDEELYKKSTGNKEWLGTGVYFYFDFFDAYEWNNSEVIMHSIIKVDKEHIIDLTANEGKELFRNISDMMLEKLGIELIGGIQENQCAIADMIWDVMSDCEVMIGSFPIEKRKVKTLTEFRRYRKEFCVRNNKNIIYTSMSRKSDLIE